MAVGKERIAGGLVMQAQGDRVLIGRAPVPSEGRGLMQDHPHFYLRLCNVEEFCEKLQQCAEEV